MPLIPLLCRRTNLWPGLHHHAYLFSTRLQKNSSPLSADDGYFCSKAEYHGLTCYDCTLDLSCSNYTLASPAANATNLSCSNLFGIQYAVQGCNTGYHWDGSECIKNQDDGSDYPFSKCPANASCKSRTFAGKTLYQFTKCNSGYYWNNSSCSKENCPNYPLTKCPDNATCQSQNCSGSTKYRVSSCKSGYHWEFGSCVADVDDCIDYTLTDCPEHADCEDKTCNGRRMYKLLSCDTGHHIVDNQCIINDCSNFPFDNKPVDGDGGYYYCGEERKFQLQRCIHWISSLGGLGYLWDGSNCVESIDGCADYPWSSCPENASCYSRTCDGKKLYQYKSCNSGYFWDGTKCSPKTDSCADYLYATPPEHASCVTKSCNGKTMYQVLWCYPGYHWDGNSCIINNCSKYSLTACPENAECSSKRCGSKVYYVMTGCKNGFHIWGNECIPNDCSTYNLDACPEKANCNDLWCDGSNKYQVIGCFFSFYGQHWDDATQSCVESTDCQNHPYTSKPSNAFKTSSIDCISGTKYKLISCKTGYFFNGNGCTAESCTEYPLSSAPKNANYNSQTCGSKTSYRLKNCKSGYHLNNSGSCVADTNAADYTLTRCPTNGNCDSYNGKHRLNSCRSGYILNGNYCSPA